MSKWSEWKPTPYVMTDTIWKAIKSCKSDLRIVKGGNVSFGCVPSDAHLMAEAMLMDGVPLFKKTYKVVEHGTKE